MITTTNITKEVNIEEYYVLRGIKDNGMCKKVIKEKEFKNIPTTSDIAQFLESSKADFVSVETNYRFIDCSALPFD